MKLALIGFGTVGQGLVEILRDKAASLSTQYNFNPVIVAVATRTRGTLYHPQGLDMTRLLGAIQSGHLDRYPGQEGLLRNQPAMELIAESNADVMVELSYSNLETAQPALDYCETAFHNGKHVVLANKGPVALAMQKLESLAKEAGRMLRFEATVMAGTPALHLASEGLAGSRIQRARGILNGTTNYILTQMETGMSYDAALKQAQELGYAEADPTADVGGWDAAGKALILSNVLFGSTLTMDDLDVTGITDITAEAVQEAQDAGERWKLIAEITPEEGSIRPVRLPLSNPLANISGATNAITYSTDLMGDVTLIGAGAGKSETGAAVLEDLLSIHRYQEN